jgi:hypothetical protein
MKGYEYPKVYVIILNWNNYEDTKRCLESLQKVTYPNLLVIVVDNASTDNSNTRLKQGFAHLQFISNEKNLGFAKGCNVGIEAALSHEECAYVLLLNNDSVVAPNFLEGAVATAEADNMIGLVGGKILESPESRKIWYAGGYINRWRGQAITRGFGEVDHGQYDQSCYVGFVTGGLMLIKREVLKKVGSLPEEYFFGVEEWDYSLNVQRAGYKLYYAPEFVVYHRGDGSHWNYDPKFVYNYYRNKLIFQEKFIPKGLFPIWKFFFYIYGRCLARGARQKLINKYDKDKFIPIDDLDFALREAIKDHRRNVLSEEVMTRFEEVLKRRKSAK